MNLYTSEAAFWDSKFGRAGLENWRDVVILDRFQKAILVASTALYSQPAEISPHANI